MIFRNYHVLFEDILTVTFVASLPKRQSIWRRVSSDCMQRSFNKVSNESAGTQEDDSFYVLHTQVTCIPH